MTDPLGPCAHFAVVLRSPHVEDGLAARLADPLWMLARQWQLGEFRGYDAGSLVSLNFEADAYAPTWWRPEPDAEHATAQPWQSWTVRPGPLEATIAAERDDGSAWLRLCIDGGVAARRALCAAGLASAAAALPAVAPWPPPGPTPPRRHCATGKSGGATAVAPLRPGRSRDQSILPPGTLPAWNTADHWLLPLPPMCGCTLTVTPAAPWTGTAPTSPAHNPMTPRTRLHRRPI